MKKETVKLNSGKKVTIPSFAEETAGSIPVGVIRKASHIEDEEQRSFRMFWLACDEALTSKELESLDKISMHELQEAMVASGVKKH